MAAALAAGRPLDLIPGISWKKNGRLVENFERRVQPVERDQLAANRVIAFQQHLLRERAET